jgi:thioredoxin-like negative regulator of GroEL
VHKKASADYIGGKAFGKSITVVEAGTYEELVASTSEDVLFDLYAPWCILCARNKPVYEELASRISEVNQKFYAYSHSRIPQARHSTSLL